MGIEAAVEAGGIARGISALERTAPLGKVGWSLVNEGPVAARFLENTMPLSFDRFNPIRVISNPFKEDIPAISLAEPILKAPTFEPLSVEEVVKEAKHWLGIPEPQVEPQAIARASKAPEPKFDVILGPMLAPHKTGVMTEKKFQPASMIKPGSQVSYHQTQAIGSPITQEQLLEVKEEKVTVESHDRKDLNALKVEHLVFRKKFLVDENALIQRIYEVMEAVTKAAREVKRLGLKEIFGHLITKHMPSEHAGNRSQIIQPNGPDGSLDDTHQTITAKKFNSENEAREGVTAVVLQNTPVKEGENGQPVQDEAVQKVLKHQLVKKPLAHQVLVKRVIEKKAQVVPGQVSALVDEQTQVKEETSLKDFPTLAEVFQKAA